MHRMNKVIDLIGILTELLSKYVTMLINLLALQEFLLAPRTLKVGVAVNRQYVSVLQDYFEFMCLITTFMHL